MSVNALLELDGLAQRSHGTGHLQNSVEQFGKLIDDAGTGFIAVQKRRKNDAFLGDKQLQMIQNGAFHSVRHQVLERSRYSPHQAVHDGTIDALHVIDPVLSFVGHRRALRQLLSFLDDGGDLLGSRRKFLVFLVQSFSQLETQIRTKLAFISGRARRISNLLNF